MPMPSALCAFEERYGRLPGLQDGRIVRSDRRLIDRIEYEHGEMLWFTRVVYRIKTFLQKMANGGKG